MGCTSSKAADATDPPASRAKEVSATDPQPAASASKPTLAEKKSGTSSFKAATPTLADKKSGTSSFKMKKSGTEPVEQAAKAPPKPSFGTTEPPPEGKQLREAEDKPKIIFVIGGPGSGKGTQCAKIVEKYGGGIRHISSGDLLRAEVSKGTDLGKELEGIMKSGELVSDDQVITLLEKEISSSAWFGMAYLVDGFPRAVPQAGKFERRVRPADLVLYFECPEKTMKERILERGKTSGRQDDNEKTVKDRIKTFNKQSLPVVQYYGDQDKLVQISAVPAPDDVFEKVADELEKFFEGSNKMNRPDQAEVSKWRTPHVLDMEKRFYGDLQDEGPDSTPAVGTVDPETLPTTVNVVH